MRCWPTPTKPHVPNAIHAVFNTNVPVATDPMRNSAIKIPSLKRTAQLSIRTLDAPRQVKLPIANMTPCVSVGDRVEQDALVASSFENNTVYQCAHAPFPGIVTANGKSTDADQPEPMLEILVDVQREPASDCSCRDPHELKPQEISEIARLTGLVGMGGGRFPTYLKLQPNRAIDWVIINGCESEPYVTCDRRVLLEHRKEVECGMRLAMRAVGAPNGTIATDEHDFLSGYETNLTFNALGRKVPKGSRPSDVGVIVINVQTARALHRAVCEGRCLTDRIVTVDGNAVARPGNYVVKFGTEIGDVLSACGIDWSRVAKLVEGGPMMGSEAHQKVPVSAGTIAILGLAEDEISKTNDDPCIRCGRCQEACEFGLPIARLLRRPTSRLLDCIECGMCQFACPARRLMVSKIRQAKKGLVGKRK